MSGRFCARHALAIVPGHRLGASAAGSQDGSAARERPTTGPKKYRNEGRHYSTGGREPQPPRRTAFLVGTGIAHTLHRRGTREGRTDHRVLCGILMHALDVLGDPVRLRILELLVESEHASGKVVEVISREFGITQSAVSQQLKVLRESGFARYVQRGRAAPMPSTRGRWPRSTPGWSRSGASGARGSRPL